MASSATTAWTKYFDLGWVCGNSADVIDETVPSSDPDENLGRVWSGLEYEPSWEGDEETQSVLQELNKAMHEADFSSNSVDAETLRSCQTPQERGSNIPVLRELPSFGSTLATNSLNSASVTSFSRAASYSRTGSSDSRKNRFFVKPALRNAEESPVFVKHNFAEADTNSFIFLQQ